MKRETRYAEIVAWCRARRATLLPEESSQARSRNLEFVDSVEEAVFARLEVEAKAHAKELADNWWRNQMSEGQVP
jgi:hypothetical protein